MKKFVIIGVGLIVAGILALTAVPTPDDAVIGVTFIGSLLIIAGIITMVLGGEHVERQSQRNRPPTVGSVARIYDVRSDTYQATVRGTLGKNRTPEDLRELRGKMAAAVRAVPSQVRYRDADIIWGGRSHPFMHIVTATVQDVK